MDSPSTNPQPALPILPPEILQLIIDRLAIALDDTAAEHWPACALELERQASRQTLVACHGLSSFLRDITATYLFRNVDLRFDTEREDRRTSALYSLVWFNPQSHEVLRHIRNVSVFLPDLPVRRKGVYDDLQAWLSHFLNYSSATIPPDSPTQLLTSLRVIFNSDPQFLRRWTSLNDSIRAALYSVCQSTVLTHRLAFVRAADVPRSLFRDAGARVLELAQSWDPDIPEPRQPSHLVHGRQAATVEEVITEGRHPFLGLVGVRVITVVAMEDHAFLCLSRWQSTLEELSIRVFDLASRTVRVVLASCAFLHLERINVTDLDFASCTCISHDSNKSLTTTVSFNPFFSHLITALDNLIGCQQSMPVLRQITIKIRLRLGADAFTERWSCAWYAHGCREARATSPWSLVDEHFVRVLESRLAQRKSSVAFRMEFVTCLPNVPASPGLVHYWKEYASAWLLGSPASILSRSLALFPDNFTFTSSCIFQG